MADDRGVTSFIVPAWNEAGLVGATIDAIHAACRALGEPYEIIVADDGSTDETATIAAQHGARVVTALSGRGGRCTTRDQPPVRGLAIDTGTVQYPRL